jgi:hypothetical protein
MGTETDGAEDSAVSGVVFGVGTGVVFGVGTSVGAGDRAQTTDVAFADAGPPLHSDSVSILGFACGLVAARGAAGDGNDDDDDDDDDDTGTGGDSIGGERSAASGADFDRPLSPPVAAALVTALLRADGTAVEIRGESGVAALAKGGGSPEGTIEAVADDIADGVAVAADDEAADAADDDEAADAAAADCRASARGFFKVFFSVAAGADDDPESFSGTRAAASRSSSSSIARAVTVSFCKWGGGKRNGEFERGVRARARTPSAKRFGRHQFAKFSNDGGLSHQLQPHAVEFPLAKRGLGFQRGDSCR